MTSQYPGFGGQPLPQHLHGIALDPFLRRYAAPGWPPTLFHLGAPLSPTSVRDQVVRGARVVDRLSALSSPNMSVGIIGSGVCGVSAAVHASRAGFRTTLFSSAPATDLLARFRNCFSRLILVSGYEWPMIDPSNATMDDDLFFRFDDGIANSIASQLQARFEEYSRSNTSLSFRERRVDGWPRWDSANSEFVLPDGERFNVLLSCVGPGEERTGITGSEFRGFPFWCTDPCVPVGRVNSGIAVVAGGGDGALQDFLRLTTNVQNPFDLVVRSGIKPSQVLALARAESRHQRDMEAENPLSPERAHASLSVLHATYETVVKQISQGGLEGIQDLLSDHADEVRLVFPCSHFSACYGINRFGALLVQRVLQELEDTSVFRPLRRVKSIRSGDQHVCERSPEACDGKEHRVEIEGSTCPSVAPEESPVISFENATRVVIRFGIKPPALIPPGGPRVVVPPYGLTTRSSWSVQPGR